MRTLPPVRKVFVHLLVHDPEGLIPCASTNLRVACEPKSLMPESGSTLAMANVITCPLCLQSAEYTELHAEMDPTSLADRNAARATVSTSSINQA